MGCKQNSQFYIALLGDAILITFHTLLTHDGIVGHADPEQQSHRHRVTIPTAQDTSSSFRLIFFADSTMPRAISFGSLFDNSSCITCSSWLPGRFSHTPSVQSSTTSPSWTIQRPISAVSINFRMYGKFSKLQASGMQA